MAFIKDIFREIKNTFGRFLGIFAIVALGVSFFSGIGVTGSNMKLLVDEYLDNQNLMDIKVVSNYGITNKDIKKISEIKEIKQIEANYDIDVFVSANQKELVGKAHSLNIEDGIKAPINNPKLIAGYIPIKLNEILVEENLLYILGVNIGDTINIHRGSETDIRNVLKNSTYKISGVVMSPLYISEERGSGNLGNGIVDSYIYIPEDNFLNSVYSEVNIILKNTKELLAFTDEYKNIVDGVIEKIEDIGDIRVVERKNELTNRTYEKIYNTEKQLEKLEKELNNKFLLEEKNILDGKNLLENSLLDIDNNYKKIEREINPLKETKSTMDLSKSEILLNLGNLEEEKADLNLSKIEISNSYLEIENGKKKLQEEKFNLKNIFGESSNEYKLYLEEILKQENILENSYNELENNENSLNTGISFIDLTKSELEQQLQQLESSILELEIIIEELEFNKIEILNNRKNINKNKNELENSEKLFLIEKNKAYEEIQKGKDELKLIRNDLKNMAEPKWYVLDRKSNLGYSSYSEDADKITAIGKVFPLIFFLVAALVSLTTMTRLVEEKRMEIGTLKSLGYNNQIIMSKYIIYAIVPTLLGGLLGGYFGMRIFPSIIINAYRIMYSVPSPTMIINYGFWIRGILFALVCTVTATFFACINELKEVPSMLMRPKAPKEGKRILLERIGFVWKRLSFIQKVTVRNIFRYKKRFFMTVIGIGGCTALLITGFGLKDSITAILDRQFGQVYKYDSVISFEEDAKETEKNQTRTFLLENKNTRQFTNARKEMLDTILEDGKKQLVYIVVAEDLKDFDSFITLKDKSTGEKLNLTGEGVLVTEKISKLLELEKGDTITLQDGDKENFDLKVSGIVEHYFLHYVYMTRNYYEQIFNEEYKTNTIYLNFPEDIEIKEMNTIASNILDKKGVTSLKFTYKDVENFQETLESLNFVVLVLIISAGTLAFIVLLNLTSININERIRELATISVLGFYDNEVSAYVYRENILLTIIGAFVGLLLGVVLHRYIIISVETDLVMFSNQINFISYVYSFLLTLIFSLIVNLITSGSLKKIDMVEALKSVE